MRLSALLLASALLTSGNEPARPLTARGLDNLVAFTRLLGSVRYFHPSDQAAAADWDSFAIAGVKRVEGAADAAELARVLEDLFRPVAPTVIVRPWGPRPPLPAALARPSGEVRTVQWRHLGAPQAAGMDPLFRSLRVDDRAIPSNVSARMLQNLDAAPFRGKKVRLRAAVRAELPAGHHARLWMRVDRPGGQKGFEDDMADRPLDSGPWRSVEITGEVAPDAYRIMIGLILDREGRAWLDDVSLEILGDPPVDAHAVANPSLEDGTSLEPVVGWSFWYGEPAAGYSITRSDEQPHGGRFSALLASADPKSLVTAKPDEPLWTELGGGVWALVPLALWADGAGTLPHAAAADSHPPVPDRPAGWQPTGDDRATRLAGIALGWSILQHFFPYADVATAQGTDWAAVLRSSLQEAAVEPGADAFASTLRRLLAALHDSHCSVMRGPDGGLGATPPIAWEWIEGQLVVVWADAEKAGGIRAGDILVSIDGKPAADALAAAETLTSGATPQAVRDWAIFFMPAGPKDQEVRFEVQPMSGPAKTVTLRRTLPFFGPGSALMLRAQALPPALREVRPGIFYLDLSRLSDGDLTSAMDRLAAARGVIFDLREHPFVSPMFLRHLTDRPLLTAIEMAPLATRPDHKDILWLNAQRTWLPQEPRLRGKIAFLTGGRGFSVIENYMTVVEAYHLGEIVGSPTAGTTGNMSYLTLPGDYTITWTGLRVVKPFGAPNQGVGVAPTVPAAQTRAGVAAGRDDVLEKAIEVVDGEAATSS